MIRLAIRGLAGPVKVFEDHIAVEDDAIEDLLPKLAEQHARKMVAHEIHMIEIEFLDEDWPFRFFRFGADHSGMVVPIAIDLDLVKPPN